VTVRPGPGADGLALEILPDAASAGRAAAARIAREVAVGVRERGRFLLALSGGRTPGPMLRALAREALPWGQVHLFQVDERAAPEGDPERNWTQICVDLLDALDPAGPGPRLHPMPAAEPDLAAAAERYAGELEAVAGRPPVLDLVQLGLGDDGHTASLVPGDAVLARLDAPVAATGLYRGLRRLTLTLPTLAAARRVIWLVTGGEKREALRRLRAADAAIPAGRVARGGAVVYADAAAAGAAADGDRA
jgi:6-phosphogluconolactonase